MRGLVSLLRERMQMLREDAQAIAAVVEDAFHGSTEVQDDDLDAQVRQLFYDLQDAEVLSVKRREYTENGQLLRGYTWQVMDHQARLAPLDHPRVEDPMDSLYGQLGDQAWTRRKR